MHSPLTLSADRRRTSAAEIVSLAAALLVCASAFADSTAAPLLPSAPALALVPVPLTAPDPIPELALAPSPLPAPAPVPAPDESPAVSSATAEILSRDKPLSSLQASIKAPQGDMPVRIGISRPPEPPVFGFPYGNARMWMCTPCEWDAPATRHLPLYFEDPNLERMGYTRRWHCDRLCCEENPNVAECIQPVVSGAQFVGRIPLMPILICKQPPLIPVYTLGADRPGSPLCYRSYRCPVCLPPSNAAMAKHEAGLIPPRPWFKKDVDEPK